MQELMMLIINKLLYYTSFNLICWKIIIRTEYNNKSKKTLLCFDLCIITGHILSVVAKEIKQIAALKA